MAENIPRKLTNTTKKTAKFSQKNMNKQAIKNLKKNNKNKKIPQQKSIAGTNAITLRKSPRRKKENAVANPPRTRILTPPDLSFLLTKSMPGG